MLTEAQQEGTRLSVCPNRIYRHFKGKHYLVTGIAADADSGKLLVIYRALYGDCQLYVRPLEEFLSFVDRKKYPNATQEYCFELSELER